MRAVDGVFDDYRAAINRQHTEMAQSVSLAVGIPGRRAACTSPRAGLEMLVRYPVPLDRVAEVDDRIARALLEAIDAEPRLALAARERPPCSRRPRWTSRQKERLFSST